MIISIIQRYLSLQTRGVLKKIVFVGEFSFLLPRTKRSTKTRVRRTVCWGSRTCLISSQYTALPGHSQAEADDPPVCSHKLGRLFSSSEAGGLNSLVHTPSTGSPLLPDDPALDEVSASPSHKALDLAALYRDLS